MSLSCTNYGSRWDGFITSYTHIQVPCYMRYQSSILIINSMALLFMHGGGVKKMNSYNGAKKCPQILWYSIWYLCSHNILHYMWIVGLTGIQFRPISGYLWVVHMMSRRYEDTWNLGNVPNWTSFTIEIASLRFSDRMSYQLNDVPSLAQ